jgi:hypothetical protein
MCGKTSFALCLALFAFAATVINGKVVRKRQSADGSCDAQIFNCISQFGILYMNDQLAEEILANGLDQACSQFIDAKNCFEAALRNCGDDNPYKETVTLIIEIVRFGCEQEVRVINENRACLFGQPMRTALENECPAHGLGHICALASDNECAFYQVENRCNPALANKFRTFTKKVQKGFGCRTARSVREVLRDIFQR